MEPIYKLTKKESDPKNWSSEQDKTFQEILNRLTSPPVLAPPRFDRSFVIETDASAKAIAACLLQADIEGELHPIIYSSRLLTPAESRYTSIESEALALIFAHFLSLYSGRK